MPPPPPPLAPKTTTVGFEINVDKLADSIGDTGDRVAAATIVECCMKLFGTNQTRYSISILTKSALAGADGPYRDPNDQFIHKDDKLDGSHVCKYIIKILLPDNPLYDEISTRQTDMIRKTNFSYIEQVRVSRIVYPEGNLARAQRTQLAIALRSHTIGPYHVVYDIRIYQNLLGNNSHNQMVVYNDENGAITVPDNNHHHHDEPFTRRFMRAAKDFLLGNDTPPSSSSSYNNNSAMDDDDDNDDGNHHSSSTKINNKKRKLNGSD